MAKQLLDRANIGTVEQQLCGKRVAEGMGGRRLVDPRITNGLANRLLNSRYMKTTLMRKCSRAHIWKVFVRFSI